DHDGDTRPGQSLRERYIGECGADGCQCWLWATIAAREAKIPVVDSGAASVPLVSPGVREGARATGGEHGSKLPIERARLGLLTVPSAVQSKLAHDQRAIARKILQAREVGLQMLRLLE